MWPLNLGWWWCWVQSGQSGEDWGRADNCTQRSYLSLSVSEPASALNCELADQNVLRLHPGKPCWWVDANFYFFLTTGNWKAFEVSDCAATLAICMETLCLTKCSLHCTTPFTYFNIMKCVLPVYFSIATVILWVGPGRLVSGAKITNKFTLWKISRYPGTQPPFLWPRASKV